LRGRPRLAAIFGFFGGPASYLAGQKLGGIVFNHEFAALLTLAIGWAVIMPILIWLAENLDGMPGRRRNWIAERIR
jgi:hypothetical protein